MTNIVQLDAKLDISAASELLTTLKSQDGEEVVLDFEKVTHLGALCLQVLLAAAKTFSDQGRTLAITNVSDRVSDQLRVMGMTPETVARGQE